MNDQVFHISTRLQHYKSINPYDPTIHEPGRHTFCHIMVYIRKGEGNYPDGWHKFEVRGFGVVPDYSVIEVSCVNWSLAAGTCTLTIDEVNCHRFKILEDEPTIQVLYG